MQLNKTIIGMVHVAALPGTPKNILKPKEIISKAVGEAMIYKKNGIDAIAIENMHDVPYMKQAVGPEIVATMSIIASEVKAKTQLPCGIQILAGANKAALAIAQAAGLDFVRIEGFAFSHIADEGIFQSTAGELMRYRKAIGAENIQIFSDIRKKHASHAITADLDSTDIARAHEFFLSDGLIVTGKTTGKPADLKELQAVKKVTTLPVIIGSGITFDNIAVYFQVADGFIVGSYFKKHGVWQNDVDTKKVSAFMQKVQSMR